MVGEAADVARAEEGAVVLFPAIFLIVHQQEIRVEDMRPADLMNIGTVCQPGIGHDKLVQTAPKVLVLVGTVQTLPGKDKHQVVECVSRKARAELLHPKKIVHTLIGGIIVEVAGNQDFGMRILRHQ